MARNGDRPAHADMAAERRANRYPADAVPIVEGINPSSSSESQNQSGMDEKLVEKRLPPLKSIGLLAKSISNSPRNSKA